MILIYLRHIYITMTHNEYTEKYCKGQQRTAAYRIKSVCGITYAGNAELTNDELNALIRRFDLGAKTERKQRNEPRNKSVNISTFAEPVKIETLPQLVVAQVAPRKTIPQNSTAKPQNIEAQILFFAPLMVNAFSIAVTVAGLYKFAGIYGSMLGAMFALTLIVSIVVSRNNQKGDTSEFALKVVLFMEFAACLLHPFTFYTVLPECDLKYGTDLRYLFAPILAGAVAFLSYNAVKTVRYYYAEN